MRNFFIVFVLLLLALVLTRSNLMAEEHVVSADDLRKSLVDASARRQENLVSVQNFLDSETAKDAMKTAQLDPVEVKKAVSTLNDDELARLAAQIQPPQNNLAAGALTNQQLTYIVIALAAAVLVLVLV
jgi:hypothetical protein